MYNLTVFSPSEGNCDNNSLLAYETDLTEMENRLAGIFVVVVVVVVLSF